MAVEDQLSEQQRQLLVDLLHEYERWEAWEADHPDENTGLAAWGVHWDFGSGTPSERASLSRAVRRLEDRGLLQRRNDISGDRYCDGRVVTQASRDLIVALGGDPDAKWERPERQHRTTHLKLTLEGRALAQRSTHQEARIVNREDERE